MPPTVRALAIACAVAAVAAGSSCKTSVIAPGGPTASTNLAAEAVERGRLLSSTTCASCHATGATGVSPLPEATPFREIVRRRPLDQLEEGFAQGLVTTHPAMPEFSFRASEIDDIIAYLETLKADQ